MTIYAAGFDVSQTGATTFKLSTSGKSDATVTINTITATAPDTSTTTLFLHAIPDTGVRPTSSDIGVQDYAAFAAALQSACQTAITAQSWSTPSGFTVTWSGTTGKFTFFYSVQNFGINTFADSTTSDIIGFSGDQSGASTYTSDIQPSYTIAPTLTATSDDSPLYEPGGIASMSFGDDGTSFGITRGTSPLYVDFEQQYEVKAKTLRLNAASAHPWTFQHLFEHCRTIHPFLVADGFAAPLDNALVMKLRPETSGFDAKRAVPGDDAHFHMRFKCVAEGYIA